MQRIFIVAGVIVGLCAAVGATETQAPDEQILMQKQGVKFAYPRWSNDGSHILYQCDETGTWQLFTADRDGSDVSRITSGKASCYFADWSPDNRRIAFVSDRTGDEEVYVMNADGSDMINLSQSEARDIHPYWTPDGSAILFNSTRDDPSDWSLDIFEIKPDGTGLRQLTQSPDVETCARLSPDGKRMVYLKMSSTTDHDDICLREVDGTERKLTDDPARDGWPAWSPDGERVVYSSLVDGRFCLVEQTLADGTTRFLTKPSGGVSDCRAQYSPDGTEILFNRDIDDSTIAVVRLKLN